MNDDLVIRYIAIAGLVATALIFVFHPEALYRG
jgi:hypothetical protein